MRRCFPFIISRDGDAIAKWFAISRAPKSEIRLGIFRISFDISMEQAFVVCVTFQVQAELLRAEQIAFVTHDFIRRCFWYLWLPHWGYCVLFGYWLQEIMLFFCIWHIRYSCFRFVTNMHTNFDILKSDLCFWKHILKSYELSINLARSMVPINNKICLASHEFYPSNSRQAWFIQSDGTGETGLCTAH